MPIDNNGILKIMDFFMTRSFCSDQNGNLNNRVTTLCDLFYDHSQFCLYYECFLIYNAKSRWNLFRVLFCILMLCVCPWIFHFWLLCFFMLEIVRSLPSSIPLTGKVFHSYLNGCCS